MEVPITVSASEGTLRSLPGKLDSLLSEPQTRAEYELQQAEKDEIGHLKRDLEELISKYLIEPSEVEAPALTAERWVKEARELSYDVDDFVDELIYDGANARISFARKTSRFKISRLRKKLNPRGWITAEISGFRTRVEEMIQRHRSYHLDKCTMRKKWGDPDEGQLPLLHGVEAAHQLVDIDGSMKKLESMLLTDDGKLKVVSITGFGGVGKTTLAKQLYSHLKGRFECRAFVRSSRRKPDMKRLLTNMLSQLRRHQPVDAWEVPDLINNIRTHLQDKKYFIIIDDLWTLSAWDIVSCALTESNRCSRILIATEVDILAQACCGHNSDNIVTMKPLSEIGSTELFLSRVFGHEHECSEQINEVSCEIIRKCGGFPLAIIAVASLLANQPAIIDKWNYVQNSFSSNLRTNPTPEGMKQVLNLSYNNLPQRLKACMLYLSIYQEDYIIWKDDLVKQWNAEGFISEVEGKDIEEVAGSYFNELINKGMIQPVDINYNGEVLSCTVHYMVLNLMRYKSIEENFITAIGHSQTAIRLADKVRRLSLHFGNEEDATPPANMRLSQVRSLAFSGLFKCMPSINEFKLLRVLILKLWVDSDDTSYNLKEISKLFRLRYLCIDACHLSLELPAEMQQLKDLVTLEIDAKVSEVPSDIVHLHGLSHLRLPGETNLPDRIGHMTSLRTLGYYNLSSNSKDNVLNLGKLTNLWDLRLTCAVVQPDNLENNMQHLGSILGKLRNLKSLTLNTLDDAGATSMSISCDGLSSMSVPPALLERLEFSRRICTFYSLPRWIGKLNKLSILKIAVRELLWNDIDILKELPALTALSLYVRIAPSRSILFDGAGFQLLKYFKFVCTAPCLAFVKRAMPNVRKLKLGFNANCMEQYNPERAGFEHLTGIKEISVKIGGAGADAESVLMTAVSKHASNPRINVQLVDWNFYGDEDRSMSTREQEHMTPEEQDEYFGTQDEDSREVEKKQADSRISTLSESSSRLPVGELKKDESKPSIVEDATVTASTGAMNSLVTKLSTLIAELIGTRRKEVMILKDEIGAMNALLEKLADMAELNMQMEDWRNQMREITYDIEDCIDDLMLHFDKDNAEPGFIHQATAYPEKWDVLRKFIHQIQNLTRRVVKADLGSMVHKTEVLTLGSRYMSTESRLPTVYDRANVLVGMDGPRDELVRWLMDGEQQQKVVCILGPGGLGKTTLAKEVYNKIKGRFGGRVFVPVPQKIGIKRLLKNMLSQLNHPYREPSYWEPSYWEPSYGRDMEDLSDKIRRCLQDKRYLIVLDGVWSTQIWKYIQRALPKNNGASRIIITTNIRDVAESCVSHSSCFIYHMRPLHPDDSYRLFRSIIFGSERSCPIALEKVGDEILEACGGIPLAIIIIASFLANKPTEVAQWEMVEKRMDPVEKGDLTTEGMKKIFHICYSDLPRHMKSCLLYLSVFPGNQVIRKDRVIWRWIAEGFIPRRGEESLWEIGESYFQELICRKMIEPTYDEEEDDDVPTSCKVHGVILEFIRSLSNEENFVTTDAKTTYMRHGVIRRLTVSYSNQEEEDAFWPITEDLSKVRSLTISGDVQRGFPSTLIRMCFLRVLDLEDTENLGICHLKGIGRLVLLRYLGLRGTGIEVLPEEIGELQKLETLDLRWTTRLRTLPASIVGLQKLARLLLDRCLRRVELPREIWKMEKLEELSTIVVDSNSSFDSVAELLIKSKRLRMLGVRWDWDVHYYALDRETTETNFRSFLEMVGKSNLQSLLLDSWVPPRSLMGVGMLGWSVLLDILLDSWVPPHHLRRFELIISVPYRGVPPKVASLVNLTHLRISINKVEAEGLRVLGDLPNLILLKLESVVFDAERRLVTSRDGFRCLVVFSYTCAGIGLQFTPGAMPQLRRLRIEFSASKTEHVYGNLDFGIQHLSCLTRIHAAIQCQDGEELEAAEAAITEQVSKNPNSPVLELSRESDLPFF